MHSVFGYCLKPGLQLLTHFLSSPRTENMRPPQYQHAFKQAQLTMDIINISWPKQCDKIAGNHSNSDTIFLLKNKRGECAFNNTSIKVCCEKKQENQSVHCTVL